MNKLAIYRKKVDRLLAEREAALLRYREEKKGLKKAKTNYTNLLEAQEEAQKIVQSIQQHTHRQIAHLVTRCLKAVFGKDGYDFLIRFEKKRGKTEAKLLLSRDGQELSPRSGVGGGVQDVASFALRLTSILMTKPSSRRLLVMDEGFKFVHSEEYRTNVRRLLEVLSEEMDFQIILSTGIEEYRIGRVIDLGA